jgi:hypothetical protein
LTKGVFDVGRCEKGDKNMFGRFIAESIRNSRPTKAMKKYTT